MARQIARGVVSNITTSEPLFPNQTLVSSGQISELGFFTPYGSENQYVGIWYKNFTPSKIVWLVDGQQNIVWSTNAFGWSNYTLAVLLDSGNFVLQDANNNEIWGNFDHPTDTLLSTMKIGVNALAREKKSLISWRSDSDPSSGSFLSGMTMKTPPLFFTWSGSTPHRRSGQWDKLKFIGIQNMGQLDLIGKGIGFLLHVPTTVSELDGYDFRAGRHYSITTWAHENGPGGRCGVTTRARKDNVLDFCCMSLTYGTCGPFGVCNSMNFPICKCLNGFVPKSNEECNNGNWTRGCVREIELNCQKNTSTSASTIVKKDAFWQMSQMKLPDLVDYLSDIGDQEGCLSWCLRNCSFLAYSYVSTIGFMVRTKEDLVNLEEFSTAGEDLFVQLHMGWPQKAVIISLSTVAGIMFFAVFVFGLCKWRTKKEGELLQGNAWKEQLKQDDALELTLFSFDSMLLATNKFSTTSKLGQGGYGSVSKNSSSSAQGVQEFKNEIILISKLQHRNLVKVIGCCTEGDEKLLVYEYLPNKSLDTFLFDSGKKVELDWGKRFQIIEGIARRLLYLHRDSCLRVIHRDLKVSNILLDEKMNPKISDFGLAQMFEGTQVLVNTHKIVKTLGYMSPEYAMGGIFSERSDVYSFGVLLLEIVSGEKNTAMYDQGYLNLLSYVWQLWSEQLWSEGKALDLMDEAIAVSFPLEVIRCIHVGLLCVQDHAMDRPNMMNVVLMLSGESDLLQPRQPIFTFQTEMPNHGIPSQKECLWSVNTVTNTMVEGR
ncbi:hypothetical protein BT93_E2457 [Corymbia citriodora subsp. variegata]|nr:hypothetical protein BT93_E2457 [Corymbia citriodora subsp. variegata]